MAKKANLVKVLGTMTTIAGMVVSLLSDWVTEQKINERVDRKVDEAVAKRNREEKGES